MLHNFFVLLPLSTWCQMFDLVPNVPLELLTIVTKSFILDVWLSSSYASDMFKERQDNWEIPAKESVIFKNIAG